jgi:hypothetical protein
VENEHPKRPEWNIFMYKKVCGDIDTPQFKYTHRQGGEAIYGFMKLGSAKVGFAKVSFTCGVYTS